MHDYVHCALGYSFGLYRFSFFWGGDYRGEGVQYPWSYSISEFLHVLKVSFPLKFTTEIWMSCKLNRANNRHGNINRELSEVSNWFKANKLSVNATKTNYMIMGTQHMTSMEDHSVSNVDIILDKTKLKRVDKTKFLGVTIDENLSWKNHIDGITKTISRNVGMINKLKFIIPERILRTLYCTLVLPYINYGILIWGKACKTYLEKIHKLQKWAVRIISNSHYRSHSAPLFQKHDILNVHDSYKLELGVFMYKYFNGLLPMSFNTFFTKLSDIHNYDTRNKSNYNPTRNRKVFADKAIRTTGPILWNSIDKSIKNVISTKHFRKLYKSSLVSSYT